MFLKNFLIKIIKNSKTIRILSPFHFLFSDYIICYLFKNSIRTGQHHISHKLFNILNKKKLNRKSCEIFFISKIVYFELNLYINKNFFISINEEKYFFLKRFVIADNNNKLKLLSNNNFFLTKELFSKIISEFIFCDCLIPVYKKYLETEFFLNFLKSNKNKFVVELDYHWFKAIGHYYILDSLIKGILLKLINIKKIYFKIKKNKIANLYLYNFYKNILIKNNLFVKKKPLGVLNMRLVYVDRFKNFYTTEEISEYIQKKWKNKFLHNKNSSINLNDKYKFDQLKNLFGNKKIITLHIRQKGFYNLEDENAAARNSNLNSTLEVLNSINSSFIYVLMGDSNVPKINKKFKNIFNYAHSKLKSPLNDVLLIKYCDAHIGTTSGITHLTLNSNQPTLLINWYPFEYNFKNESAVILPKLLKKNNTIFSIKDYNKIKPNTLFDGISRLRDLNITYRDNTQEELLFAMNRFIKSLDNSYWVNYGIKYMIENKNFEFHQIDKNIKKEVLDVRCKIYFDPYFVKKNKGFL